MKHENGNNITYYLKWIPPIIVVITLFFLVNHIKNLTEHIKNQSNIIIELKKSCTKESINSKDNSAIKDLSYNKNLASKLPSEEEKNLYPVESIEWKAWMVRRGWMSTEELDDYRHYDRKTLEAFAASGDLKAIELLFDQELKNENENHLASYYARKGAIFGSTIGISRLIIFLHPDGILSREQNQYNFYEALALCKTLELRGDKLLSAQETSNFIKGYEKYARNKISLTSEEQQKINQRAQEIYDEWQAERHKFGIGDFDNSRPAGVDKLFDSKSLSQG